MYLYLGEKKVIKEEEIIGIFDLETTSIQKNTREFLRNAEKAARVETVSYDLPKSFVLSGGKKDWKLYLTQVSTSTLEKRAGNIISSLKIHDEDN